MTGPSTSPERDDGRERRLRATAVVISIAIVLYGVLVAGQILLPIVVILGGFVVYLFWRFVRAHERLAAAAERLADDPDDAEPADVSARNPPDENSADE